MTELLHNFIISLQEIIGYFLASRLKIKLRLKKKTFYRTVRGRGHTEEEEAAEIPSENHPQYAKN